MYWQFIYLPKFHQWRCLSLAQTTIPTSFFGPTLLELLLRWFKYASLLNQGVETSRDCSLAWAVKMEGQKECLHPDTLRGSPSCGTYISWPGRRCLQSGPTLDAVRSTGKSPELEKRDRLQFLSVSAPDSKCVLACPFCALCLSFPTGPRRRLN